MKQTGKLRSHGLLCTTGCQTKVYLNSTRHKGDIKSSKQLSKQKVIPSITGAGGRSWLLMCKFVQGFLMMVLMSRFVEDLWSRSSSPYWEDTINVCQAKILSIDVLLCLKCQLMIKVVWRFFSACDLWVLLWLRCNGVMYLWDRGFGGKFQRFYFQWLQDFCNGKERRKFIMPYIHCVYSTCNHLWCLTL